MSACQGAVSALAEAGRRSIRSAPLTPAQQALTDAWRHFVLAQRGVYAVTLSYKNRHEMTVFEGYRVSAAGEKTVEHEARCTDHAYRLPITRAVPLDSIHADLRHFHACIDRSLYGARFHTKAPERRTSYVGFVEHEDSNVHVHLSWHVPEERVFDFTDAFEVAWEQTVSFGSYWIEPIISDAWAGYITKAKRKIISGDAALFVTSTKF